MVQAAFYRLVLDRKVGEYELPKGASLIACGNRGTDRGVVHRFDPQSKERAFPCPRTRECPDGQAHGVRRTAGRARLLRSTIARRHNPRSIPDPRLRSCAGGSGAFSCDARPSTSFAAGNSNP